MPWPSDCWLQLIRGVIALPFKAYHLAKGQLLRQCAGRHESKSSTARSSRPHPNGQVCWPAVQHILHISRTCMVLHEPAMFSAAAMIVDMRCRKRWAPLCMGPFIRTPGPAIHALSHLPLTGRSSQLQSNSWPLDFLEALPVLIQFMARVTRWHCINKHSRYTWLNSSQKH